MKIIYLNIWGGILYDELRAFLLRKSDDTDIFCFSEVLDTPTNISHIEHNARADIYARLQGVLPAFSGFYTPTEYGFGYGSKPVDFPLSMGLAIFVRQSITLIDRGDAYILGESHAYEYGKSETFPTSIQHVVVDTNNETIAVGNYHGVVDKASGKGDSALTIRQYKKVIGYMDVLRGPKIIGGDMNVRPETECVKLFERAGYRNLIKEYDVERTRNRHYSYMVKHKADFISDYTFTSPGVHVSDFRVLPDIVSDHQALMLSISLGE